MLTPGNTWDHRLQSRPLTRRLDLRKARWSDNYPWTDDEGMYIARFYCWQRCLSVRRQNSMLTKYQRDSFNMDIDLLLLPRWSCRLGTNLLRIHALEQELRTISRPKTYHSARCILFPERDFPHSEKVRPLTPGITLIMTLIHC